ncbi:dihydrofolate reductase family protein [Leucobacter sp. VD1]|uniref:dihydrofolate reductase family protein n=1 Tax=Leucobacter sp. VD1 TaxID=3080381 RepID=UPI00301AD335
MATHFYRASTLDGFIATLDHSLEWLFAHDFDLEGPMAYPAFIEGVGALVMGASTYEWLLRNEQTWGYTQPTWVLTHRELPVPEGADVRFAQGKVQDLHEAITASAGERDVWVVGGGDLAGQFAEAGLLDEFWVQFAPVMLGEGRPLLPRRLDLELIDTVRNRDFVCARYRVRPTAERPEAA